MQTEESVQALPEQPDLPPDAQPEESEPAAGAAEGSAAAKAQPDEPQVPLAGLAELARSLRQGTESREETFRALQQREAQRVFREDLAAIRAAWPDEKAKSIAELGPQFAAICAAGVEPLAAYEALRAQRRRRSAPSTGPVAGAGGDGDYYTRDEVARMSREEIHRNFDKIRRSMRRW